MVRLLRGFSEGWGAQLWRDSYGPDRNLITVTLELPGKECLWEAEDTVLGEAQEKVIKTWWVHLAGGALAWHAPDTQCAY